MIGLRRVVDRKHAFDTQFLRRDRLRVPTVVTIEK
jgi:hypothetical protein